LDPGGTVFAEFTALALKHNAVNLGQGFPTLPVPEFIRQAAVETVQDPCLMHQYTRSEGNKSLCQGFLFVHTVIHQDSSVIVLSQYYQSKLNRALNPMTEIVTTVGASEGLFLLILSQGSSSVFHSHLFDDPSVHQSRG
jgi:aspartate/methionine/tyrosine aminotransferase